MHLIYIYTPRLSIYIFHYLKQPDMFYKYDLNGNAHDNDNDTDDNFNDHANDCND